MSEVKRVEVLLHGPLRMAYMVEATHFDRVTAERDALQARLTAADELNDVMRGLMQEFCDRVDRGEVRSKKTYAKFKAALKPAEAGADSCEFCKGWGFRGNPETGTDEGCGACNGTGKEPSDDQP